MMLARASHRLRDPIGWSMNRLAQAIAETRSMRRPSGLCPSSPEEWDLAEAQPVQAASPLAPRQPVG
jgi:hypothetical protein